jgi:ribosome maturation factor RimP
VGVNPLSTFTQSYFNGNGDHMKRDNIENLVSQEVEKIIEGTDLELVDVEYVREREWYLRVFIDKAGGVGLEDCQSVSERLGKYLDEKDPIADNYLLEVSSPGLDRILKKDKDFIRYGGRTVDIHFFKPHEGSKLLVAELVGKEGDDTLVVKIEGTSQRLNMKDISQIRLHLDF